MNNNLEHQDIDDIYIEEMKNSENSEKTIEQDKLELFNEISEWKLEAKLENNNRYFYHTTEVKRIENGSKCFVIGRKGCGKTAISEYLTKIKKHDYFSVKLTFKNFPFNELYNLPDTGYTSNHQYITLWKFLIYSHVCQLMANNEKIESSIREKLNNVYTKNQQPTLSRKINKWLDRDFGAEIFGIGINIGKPESAEERQKTLIERVNQLEDIIIESIDESKYLIIFDELDEDYKTITEKEQFKKYTALVTSLFKAAQDVKSVFQAKDASIHPTIFLRDDIYEILQDSDKTKWNDLKILLDWDEEKIKKLMAFRISRAINPQGQILDFSQAWHLLFSHSKLRIGNQGGKVLGSFEFIARSTHLRPRDFIQYLKSCCEEYINLESQKQKNIIDPFVIKKVDTAFSNYLKSELSDEIHGVLPDIYTIFDIISQIRKWSFSVKEFIDSYNRQYKRSNLKEKDPIFVLQILFLFSVIGNRVGADREIFRYKHKEVRFNFDEAIVVHRGLFKSLQIGVN